jgi:hypothetical protein
MISIIICSLNENHQENVLSSINDTVGCVHEIIVIDNRYNQHSIYTAYNLGASKAMFEILCFIHEDVMFYSNNWGKVLADIFYSDNEVGLIGSCGGIVKTELPTSWVDIPSKYYISGLVSDSEIIEESKNEYQEVVVIDGLFMATTKSIWKINPFPIRRGFHGYDLYYSLCIGVFKKIVVATGIKILHKSRGSFNGNWFSITLEIHKEYGSSLPRFTDKAQIISKEVYSLNSIKFLNHLKQTPIGFSRKGKLILEYIILNRNINLYSKIRCLYYWIKLSQL